jgi:[glutamine synthetase] adenylyltransferase / [glutamine synthetase]-adenylyl-L-tyrosine phosphorylase
VAPVHSLERVAFRDRAQADANLGRIAGRVSARTLETLPNLLAESPDPDAALNLLERLCESADTEVLRLFDRHPFLVHYAIAVFGYSQWLGDALLQNLDLLHTFARERTLDRSHGREDFRETFARFQSRSFETDIAVLLGRFKRREYIRIMLRDVLGIATLADTTAEISALCDVLIEEALRNANAALRARFGTPQHLDAHGRLVDTSFAVLSLGKLGGNEVNYSSDVDLLYLHGDGDAAPGAAIGAREYFIRLAQETTEVLTRLTREGAVFRIDLRLRPQGGEGEPSVGLSHALRYYAATAHDWERQALIKIRHSAGDVALAREFIRGVQPYVYTDQVNFAAIETALSTREKIGARQRRAAQAQGIDVKLDAGGIRDIEFLVQCLQRVYGGKERWLRSGGTLFSLQKLHDKGHLSGKEFHELNTAYTLLRNVEHRLQLRRGQQVHRLSAKQAEKDVLTRSMRQEERRGRSFASIEDEVRARMAAVGAIYERIIHSQQQRIQERTAADFRLLSAVVTSAGEQSFQQILAQLANDSPRLHEIVARRDMTSHARRNLQRFLNAALTSSERYGALLHSPEAVERALRIFEVSDYLTDILTRHPEEIEGVEEFAPRAAEQPALVEVQGKAAPDPVFEFVAASDTPRSEKLHHLRRHYRHRVFVAGARDVMQPRAVYDSLAEMTAAADDAVRAAWLASGAAQGFAVLALGRLGTQEFDIASDADLVFVRAPGTETRVATRAAEDMVSALAAYTNEGTTFAVDVRLRPRGAEGELVNTAEELATYFAHEAQPWEALTYTKLRFLAGDATLGEKAAQAIRKGSARFSGDAIFGAAVREMRTKLERLEASETGIKTQRGGFYDIDFIVAYLMVRQHVAAEGNTRERLYALAEEGALADDVCATLDAAAELLRAADHAIRLVTGRAKGLPAAEHARHASERLAAKILRRELSDGLETELQRAGEGIRALYDQIVK